MGLKEQLMADYKEAMKNHDAVKKNTVNLVRAAIKQHEVDQRTELNDDADIVKIIKKQVKMRTDALADFAKAGRDDMTEAYKQEIEILTEEEEEIGGQRWFTGCTRNYVRAAVPAEGLSENQLVKCRPEGFLTEELLKAERTF